MATVTGVGGTGSVGALSIQGQIIVSLLSDEAGAPGSLIAILGVFSDADLVLGTNALEIALDAPISLIPNTRYWIQVTGNDTTTYSWVQAADDNGLGIADEFWYQNASGTITTDANSAGPSFQMAVLSEPSTGVVGQANVGSLSDAIDTGIVGVAADSAIGAVRPEAKANAIDLAGVGEVGDVVTSFASFAQPSGTHGTGLVGAIAIPGKLVVSLLSDNAGAPGSLIAVLGVYEDADLSLGTMLLEIDLSSAPIALTPNTRYWIEVSGNSFTSFSWVEAADPSGAGVATELWYQDVNGAVSTGANNVGPSFQMEVLAEPPTGVYGTAEAGGLGVAVGGTISGVESSGAVGTVVIPGTIHQPISGVSSDGQSEPLSAVVAVTATDIEASGQAGIATFTEALQTPVEGVGASGGCASLSVLEAATLAGAASNGQVGTATAVAAQEAAVAGAEATGACAAFGVVDALSGAGASAASGIGNLTATSVGSASTVTISGVAGEGLAGIARRKKRLPRGGRGGKEHFTPHLFARPETAETAAEALARWRRTVDELLHTDPRKERPEPGPDPDHADFEFLNSLPLTIIDEPIAGPIEMIDWQAVAEAEDMLLLGDADLLEDEELAFDLL